MSLLTLFVRVLVFLRLLFFFHYFVTEKEERSVSLRLTHRQLRNDPIQSEIFHPQASHNRLLILMEYDPKNSKAQL